MKKKNIKRKTKKESFLLIIKYLTSGFLGMLTDVGLVFLLAQVFLINVLIANSIATVVATILNFMIQRIWAFKSKGKVVSSFAKYASVWFFNYLFTMFYLFVTVTTFEYSAGWMKLSTYLFIAVWNYFLYKHYVYKK